MSRYLSRCTYLKGVGGGRERGERGKLLFSKMYFLKIRPFFIDFIKNILGICHMHFKEIVLQIQPPK